MKTWKDVLDIGPDCVEHYVDSSRVPEIRDLDIEVAGVSMLSGQYQVGYVSACAHTLLYSVSGQGRLWTQSGETIMDSNSLTILPVRQPFLFEVQSAPWQTAWFCLEDRPRWSYLQRQQARTHYCSSAIAVFHLLSFIYHESSAQRRVGVLNQLQEYIAKTTDASNFEFNEHYRLDMLFRDVEKQLHYSWTVEGMCKKVHYSAPHLHRLCREYYGRSPVQQLIYLRMERARFLLSNTNWSLTQIASAVGYKDVFNFSNRFKKSMGLAPSIYRAQN